MDKIILTKEQKELLETIQKQKKLLESFPFWRVNRRRQLSEDIQKNKEKFRSLCTERKKQ